MFLFRCCIHSGCSRRRRSGTTESDNNGHTSPLSPEVPVTSEDRQLHSRLLPAVVDDRHGQRIADYCGCSQSAEVVTSQPLTMIETNGHHSDCIILQPVEELCRSGESGFGETSSLHHADNVANNNVAENTDNLVSSVAPSKDSLLVSSGLSSILDDQKELISDDSDSRSESPEVKYVADIRDLSFCTSPHVCHDDSSSTSPFLSCTYDTSLSSQTITSQINHSHNELPKESETVHPDVIKADEILLVHYHEFSRPDIDSYMLSAKKTRGDSQADSSSSNQLANSDSDNHSDDGDQDYFICSFTGGLRKTKSKVCEHLSPVQCPHSDDAETVVASVEPGESDVNSASTCVLVQSTRSSTLEEVTDTSLFHDSTSIGELLSQQVETSLEDISSSVDIDNCNNIDVQKYIEDIIRGAISSISVSAASTPSNRDVTWHVLVEDSRVAVDDRMLNYVDKIIREALASASSELHQTVHRENIAVRTDIVSQQQMPVNADIVKFVEDFCKIAVGDVTSSLTNENLNRSTNDDGGMSDNNLDNGNVVRYVNNIIQSALDHIKTTSSSSSLNDRNVSEAELSSSNEESTLMSRVDPDADVMEYVDRIIQEAVAEISSSDIIRGIHAIQEETSDHSGSDSDVSSSCVVCDASGDVTAHEVADALDSFGSESIAVVDDDNDQIQPPKSVDEKLHGNNVNGNLKNNTISDADEMVSNQACSSVGDSESSNVVMSEILSKPADILSDVTESAHKLYGIDSVTRDISSKAVTSPESENVLDAAIDTVSTGSLVPDNTSEVVDAVIPEIPTSEQSLISTHSETLSENLDSTTCISSEIRPEEQNLIDVVEQGAFNVVTDICREDSIVEDLLGESETNDKTFSNVSIVERVLTSDEMLPTNFELHNNGEDELNVNEMSPEIIVDDVSNSEPTTCSDVAMDTSITADSPTAATAGLVDEVTCETLQNKLSCIAYQDIETIEATAISELLDLEEMSVIPDAVFLDSSGLTYEDEGEDIDRERSHTTEFEDDVDGGIINAQIETFSDSFASSLIPEANSVGRTTEVVDEVTNQTSITEQSCIPTQDSETIETGTVCELSNAEEMSVMPAEAFPDSSELTSEAEDFCSETGNKTELSDECDAASSATCSQTATSYNSPVDADALTTSGDTKEATRPVAVDNTSLYFEGVAPVSCTTPDPCSGNAAAADKEILQVFITDDECHMLPASRVESNISDILMSILPDSHHGEHKKHGALKRAVAEIHETSDDDPAYTDSCGDSSNIAESVVVGEEATYFATQDSGEALKSIRPSSFVSPETSTCLSTNPAAEKTSPRRKFSPTEIVQDFFERYVLPVNESRPDVSPRFETSRSLDHGTNRDTDNVTTSKSLDIDSRRATEDEKSKPGNGTAASEIDLALEQLELDMNTGQQQQTELRVMPSVDVMRSVSCTEAPAEEIIPPYSCRRKSLPGDSTSPRHKKSVRFADSIGADLESVCQIEASMTVRDEDLTPTGIDEYLNGLVAASDRRARWIDRHPRPGVSVGTAWRSDCSTYLRALFELPSIRPDFFERVRRLRVALETCTFDDRDFAMFGVIRVANIAYHKSVSIRYTLDSWRTQTDVSAEYIPRSNDGTTDRFTFTIILPPRRIFGVGSQIEFAICYEAGDGPVCDVHWDNNFGNNYVVGCFLHGDSMSSQDVDPSIL